MFNVTPRVQPLTFALPARAAILLAAGLCGVLAPAAGATPPVANVNTSLTYPDINAALADPLTLSGHTLHVAPGVYAYSTTVAAAKAVTIEGSGRGANPATDTILFPAGDAFTLTTGGATPSDRLVIRNMLLIPGGDGVRVTAGLSYVRFENVDFICTGDGIDFDTPDPQAASDIQVVNCTFTCGGAGIRTSATADVSGVTLTSCSFDANLAPGLYLGSDAVSGSMNLANWQVLGCRFVRQNSAQGSGIWLKTTSPGSASGFVVDGCLFQDNGDSASPYVSVYNPPASSGMLVTARPGSSISGLSVSNCIFQDSAVPPRQVRGIFLNNSGGAGSIATVPVSNSTFMSHDVGILGTFNGETVCLTNVTFGGSVTGDTYGVNLCAGTVTLTPKAVCYHPGDTVIVDINSILPQVPVVGGQFFLSYDTSKLAFIDAIPGSPPFTVEVYQNAGPGTVDYAVGVPGNGPGSSASTIMARVMFQALTEVCSEAGLVTFRPHSPPTRLTNNIGDPILPTTFALTPITIDNTPPAITPPATITQNADAGVCTAAITVPPLLATDDCGVASIVNDYTGTANASGVYPVGTTHVHWTVTDTCGNVSMATQDVTVRPYNTLSVQVQLAGLDPGPIDRCITFSVDCPAPTLVSQVIHFSGGLGSALVDIPCGPHNCLSARDPLHTLRKTDADNFGISGIIYVADFTGADALEGGNLNGDSVIDILDFGLFVGQFGLNYGTPDTTCSTPLPHADISGNGSVFTEDFTFIQINLFHFDELNCCGSLVAPARHRIAVDELLATDPSLATADLNHDAWLDLADVVAFSQRGAIPCPADWNADGHFTNADIALFVSTWFNSLQSGNLIADFDHNGFVQSADIAGFISTWSSSLGGGC